MEMLEFNFFTRCTCGEDVKAELRYENTTIEIEPCKRCLNEALKSGLKKEIIEPLEREYSSDIMRRLKQPKRFKVNNP